GRRFSQSSIDPIVEAMAPIHSLVSTAATCRATTGVALPPGAHARGPGTAGPSGPARQSPFLGEREIELESFWSGMASRSDSPHLTSFRWVCLTFKNPPETQQLQNRIPENAKKRKETPFRLLTRFVCLATLLRPEKPTRGGSACSKKDC